MKRFCLCAALAFSFIGAVSFADDRASLQEAALSYQAIKADFNQKVTRSDGSLVSSSSGYFALKRPDHLIMHTVSPDEQVLFTKGNAVYFYDPFVEQVSIYDRKNLYTSPFMLLTSKDKDLWDRYEVKKSADGYVLTPKNTEEVVKLVIKLDGKNIRSISITMRDGNTNHYDLSSVSYSVSDSVFDYTIPEGTEVADERQSN